MTTFAFTYAARITLAARDIKPVATRVISGVTIDFFAGNIWLDSKTGAVGHTDQDNQFCAWAHTDATPALIRLSCAATLDELAARIAAVPADRTAEYIAGIVANIANPDAYAARAEANRLARDAESAKIDAKIAARNAARAAAQEAALTDCGRAFIAGGFIDCESFLALCKRHAVAIPPRTLGAARWVTRVSTDRGIMVTKGHKANLFPAIRVLQAALTANKES